MGECLLDGIDTVEVEDDEVGAWLVGLLDIVDCYYLAVAQCQLTSFHEFANLPGFDSQVFEFFGIDFSDKFVGNADEIGDELALGFGGKGDHSDFLIFEGLVGGIKVQKRVVDFFLF